MPVAPPLFSLWRAQRGSVAVQIGMMMTVIIGMSALGSEIVFVLFKHRQMQMIADAAALSASTAFSKGFPSDLNVEARAITAEAGFVNGVNGVVVTLNRPPLGGSKTGNTQAVEVIVSQPQTLNMVSLFVSGIFNVGARAVATAGTGKGCVLQLASARNPGVNISNGAVITLTQCGMTVDSTGAQALTVIGGAMLNAQSVSVTGQTSVNNGGAINAIDGVKTLQPAVADPYAAVVMPVMPGGCSFTNLTNPTGTLNPGNYCNGLTLGNGANVTMNPGVYFIDRGVFSVGGGITLSALNVTIILTSSTGSGYATATIANGVTVTMTARTTGATAGIVFFGDRRAPITNVNNFGGGAVINVNGAMYFPTQKVTFANGVNNPSSCTQLVAGEIDFAGGAKFQANCPVGVKGIGSSASTLVE